MVKDRNIESIIDLCKWRVGTVGIYIIMSARLHYHLSLSIMQTENPRAALIMQHGHIPSLAFAAAALDAGIPSIYIPHGLGIATETMPPKKHGF